MGMMKIKRRLLLAALLICLACITLHPAARAESVIPDLIIDKDDRMIIDNSESYPYSCVAYMDVICECGCGWESSGFVVGNGRTVLTAAHSVYCTSHSAPAESIILYFGYQNYHRNLLRYDGEWSFIAGTTFDTHEYQFSNDWAVIRLAEDIGGLTGMLETASDNTPAADSTATYRIMGYSGGKLYMDSGSLKMMDDDHFEYTMDQESGESGGPILDEQNRVVGIIIGHKEEDDGTKQNVGYRLTPEILDIIHSPDRQ